MATPLPQIPFVVGSEARFFQFIQQLNEKDKIALLSHTDLDGITAAKLVSTVIQPDLTQFCNYEELTPVLVQKLKNENVKVLILTDLSLTKEFIVEAEKHFSILIIDHHKFAEDFNSNKTCFLVSESHFCASYLCYYLFSKIQSLEKYDWLVACACIADWCYKFNQEFMSEVFKKYQDTFRLGEDQLIIKHTPLWELHWLLSLALVYYNNPKAVFSKLDSIDTAKELSPKAKEVQDEINVCLNKFEKEKEGIGDGFYWEFSPKFHISFIISSTISEKYWNKTVIISRTDDQYFHLSCRRQDGQVDLSKLMKTLIADLPDASGGGHVRASGCHAPLQYKTLMLDRLQKALNNPEFIKE